MSELVCSCQGARRHYEQEGLTKERGHDTMRSVSEGSPGRRVQGKSRHSLPTAIVTISGGNGEGVTPVPIPNTEVKPFCADGTWLVTARESRSPPESIAKHLRMLRFFAVGKGGKPGWP